MSNNETEQKDNDGCTGSCGSCHEACGSGEHIQGPSKLEQVLNTIGDIDEDRLLALINESIAEDE